MLFRSAVLALPVAGALLPALPVPVAEGLARFIGSPVTRYDAELPVVSWDTPSATGVVVGPVARPKVAPLAPDMTERVAEARAARWKVHAHAEPEIVYVETPVSVAADGGGTWPMRVFLLWLFGFVMVAVAFAVGVLRTHIVACTALPASGDALADEVEVLSAELGIVRDVRAVTWPGPAMPMTWGALRPVVLLPEDARSWPAARRREVLTHELAHVSRGDWVARLIAALACAVYWFKDRKSVV